MRRRRVVVFSGFGEGFFGPLPCSSRQKQGLLDRWKGEISVAVCTICGGSVRETRLNYSSFAVGAPLQTSMIGFGFRCFLCWRPLKWFHNDGNY